MIESQRQLFLMSFPNSSSDEEWVVRTIKLSQRLFRAAQRKARWLRLAQSLGMKRQPMLALDEMSLPDRRSSHDLPGVQAVAIDKILGSENRCTDFDGEFLPLKNHLESRWMTITALMLQSQPLPAVELIQVGEAYFVRDGHHRISAARCLGQRHIDAHITVWTTSDGAPVQTARELGALDSNFASLAGRV
ncbi:MAG TPA: hypothetical protein VLS48_05780 [Anaerolineales bacterium]|nr:hypothetical protein [Anaerolineales bacterium]